MLDEDFISRFVERFNPSASQEWIAGLEAAVAARPDASEQILLAFAADLSAEARDFEREASVMREMVRRAMRDELSQKYSLRGPSSSAVGNRAGRARIGDLKHEFINERGSPPPA